jgi:HAD superfamily hydrolase (TIGR01450 family)
MPSASEEIVQKLPEAWLLDMDGTLYLSHCVLPGAKELIDHFNQNSIPYCLFTNNSSLSRKDYVVKLENLGLDCEPSRILTSAWATILWLLKRNIQRVYLMAVPSVCQEFSDAGLILDSVNPEVVVLAFDQSLDYEKLKRAHQFLLDGVPYIATHPDLVCPTSTGSIPDCGAMIALLKASTGREPEIIGKPSRNMVDMASVLLGALPQSMAIVGDRLYTDMRMGFDHGLITVLLLSGETQAEDLKDVVQKPDYCFGGAKELLEWIYSSGRGG